MFRKWRWKAKTEQEPDSDGSEAISHGNGSEIASSKRTFHASVSRSIRKFPHLAPPNPSAEAYVAFLRANGSTGEHLQGDLYDAYQSLCVASSLVPIPWKEFGKEMRKAGCSRRQGDMTDRGRSRPMLITIPEKEGEVGSQVVGWETSKGPSRKRTVRVKRAETKRKLVGMA